MNEDDIQTQLKIMTPNHQVAFLTLCLEHVQPLYGLLNSPAANAGPVIQATKQGIEASWKYSLEDFIDNKTIDGINTAYDDFLDPDSDSALIYLTSAEDMILEYMQKPNEIVSKVLNCIETAIDSTMGEDDPASGEEREWQIKLLQFFKENKELPITREMFSTLISEDMEWVGCMNETYVTYEV